MTYLRYVRAILPGFLLGCIIYLLGVFYQIGAPTDTSFPTYERYKIKFSRANSLNIPKLVVVSGSNADSGISCKMIQEETGVVCANGAGNVALGTDYILSIARSLIKPGDIVILPLEYELYVDLKLNDQLIDYVFARDPKYFKSADLMTQIRLISGISFERLILGIISKTKIIKSKTVGESYKFINEYGDRINIREADMTEKELKLITEAKPIIISGYVKSSHNMIRISKFVDWCHKNNIKVIATWPNTISFEVYKESRYQEFFQSIEDFYKNLSVPLLGKPIDFMYDKSMFYDSVYHLNDRGVSHRTRQLIDLLRPYIQSKKV